MNIMIYIYYSDRLELYIKCSKTVEMLFIFLPVRFYHSEISKSSNVNLKKGSNKIITCTCEPFEKVGYLDIFFLLLQQNRYKKGVPVCIFKIEYEYTFSNGGYTSN